MAAERLGARWSRKRVPVIGAGEMGEGSGRRRWPRAGVAEVLVANRSGGAGRGPGRCGSAGGSIDR